MEASFPAEWRCSFEFKNPTGLNFTSPTTVSSYQYMVSPYLYHALPLLATPSFLSYTPDHQAKKTIYVYFFLEIHNVHCVLKALRSSAVEKNKSLFNSSLMAFNLAISQNHLKSFSKFLCLHPAPKEGLRCAACILGVVKTSQVTLMGSHNGNHSSNAIVSKLIGLEDFFFYIYI